MVKIIADGTPALYPERPLPPLPPLPALEAEAIGKVPRLSKGNGPAAKDSRSTAERGLLEFDIMAQERDRLERELGAAREKIKLLEIHISETEGTRTTIESRINSCVLERDNAVREAGELRGVINAIASVCVRYHHDTHQD